VEDAIHRHPAVAQCAVIGIPHETWGEAVHAVVVLRPGHSLDATAVIEHCRLHIAGFKCPRSVELREDPLPLSGVNKVNKTLLRAPHWQGRARGVN
jgi:long-chain acyl-CoA synthetase